MLENEPGILSFTPHNSIRLNFRFMHSGLLFVIFSSSGKLSPWQLAQLFKDSVPNKS